MSALLLATWALFAVAGIALVVVDVRTRRVPDVIVVPGLLAVVVLLTAEAVRIGDPSRAVGVAGGAAAAFAAFLALHVIRPAALGGGDVKLAALVGAPLGWWGPEAVASGLLLAVLLGGVAATGVVLSGARRAEMPFAPWLLLGAWARLLSGPW